MSAFDKVIGYEKEKEELYQLCDMAKNPEKYAALGVKLPRGILLHGVPGVGKTLMASALIEEMGRVCYTCRKDKANDAFVDTIRSVFAEAKAHAPAVIFWTTSINSPPTAIRAIPKNSSRYSRALTR